MTKARTLANFISDNNEFADGTISVAEVSGAAPLASPAFTADASFEGGKIIINEVTGSDAYSEIRKTNGGSNFAIVSPEALYLLVDSDNNQTNRGVVIGHNSAAPGSATSLAKIAEDGTVFNEAGANIDFRVESDSRSNALVLDGGTGGLALNTTNSDFYTGFETTSIKLGPVASMWSLSNGSTDRRMTIDQNLYVNADGTNRYLTTGAAARYQMNTGTHRFETAPSGSDDAAATSTVQMLIENGGEVRMLPSNTDAQNLKFRTTSTAGRSVIKALTREDSGSVNPMSQLQMMAYGTNSYLGQMKIVLNSSDTYNSSNQNNVADFKGTGGLVLNESGLNYLDFRVESDTNTHALFVDAGANSGAGSIGFGVSSPQQYFHQANDTGHRIGNAVQWSGNLADIANGATRTITLAGLGNYTACMVEIWVLWRMSGGSEPATARTLYTFYEGNNSISDVTQMEFSGRNIVSGDITATGGYNQITFNIENTQWAGTGNGWTAGQYYVKVLGAANNAALTVG